MSQSNSRLRSTKNRGVTASVALAAAVVAVLGGISYVAAYGPCGGYPCGCIAHDGHPATPPPCAADGMCYPKRETWGNYLTHWRAWPGESVGLTPTPAGGAQQGELPLPSFIRPRPSQEDLRGPARPVRPAAPAAGAGQAPAGGADAAAPANGGQDAPALDGAPEAAPPQDGAAPQPAGDPLELPDLPGFGPQGQLDQLPQLEEGPPSLPPGLIQALSVQPSSRPANSNVPATSTTQSPNRPTVSANANSTSRPAVSVAPAKSRYVTPTAAIDSQNIELGNPAAKNVQKSMDQDLEQAIYFEASDIE